LDLTGKVQVDPSPLDAKYGSASRSFEDGVYKGYFVDSGARMNAERVAVAIKRLHLNVSDEKLRKELVKEVKIWSEFDHPNILKLFGYTVENTYPSIVSKWIADGSLRDNIERMGRSELFSMTLDIASGLAYIHGHGAVHSDVKTNNILVSPEKRALLTDFGASRIESLHIGYTNRAVNETIRWKAVELFKLIEEGDVPPDYTFETNVWAFGMTVYEILARKIPYYHVKDNIQVMWHIAKGRLPKKPDFSESPNDAGIEEFMWSLCVDCWKTDPKSRPSMSDFERRIRGETAKY